MLNVESSSLNVSGAAHGLLNSTFNIQHSTLTILLLLLALPVFANDLQVDKRTLSIDDSLTITITLTDAFASVDNIQLPIQNLVLEGSPAVSSEFSWINGQSSRRKVFRYSAHPRGPGAALIGPVTLRAADGQVETLAPVSVQVLPDRSAGSNDPVRILHELLATGRDPIFVVADAGKTSAFVGEQVLVTWTIYNATNVQQHGVNEMPKLADFWVEELDVRGETPQQLFIGGVALQKLVIRRTALFPLRSGMLTIEPLSIEAQIMKRVDSGNPFGMLEGDGGRRSPPLGAADDRGASDSARLAHRGGRRSLAEMSHAGAEERRTGLDRCASQRTSEPPRGVAARVCGHARGKRAGGRWWSNRTAT